MHLEQDLWDAWLLTHVNGRFGTPLGQARALPAPTLEAALLTMAAVAKRRRQRGYEFSLTAWLAASAANALTNSGDTRLIQDGQWLLTNVNGMKALNNPAPSSTN